MFLYVCFLFFLMRKIDSIGERKKTDNNITKKRVENKRNLCVFFLSKEKEIKRRRKNYETQTHKR